MRGRKPTPDAIKALNGNPGKRKLNLPMPSVGCPKPTCPGHLGSEAKKEWRRMLKTLTTLGLLAATDRAALAAYCQAYGRWVEAEKKVAEVGLVAQTAAGNVIQNPYLAVANKAMEQMKGYLIEFGMTPSSRARIHAPAEMPSDPFEEMFNGQKTG